jgi:hypothetical protein
MFWIWIKISFLRSVFEYDILGLPSCCILGSFPFSYLEVRHQVLSGEGTATSEFVSFSCNAYAISGRVYFRSIGCAFCPSWKTLICTLLSSAARPIFVCRSLCKTMVLGVVQDCFNVYQEHIEVVVFCMNISSGILFSIG